MKTFDYKCLQCGRVVEVRDGEEVPKCHGREMARQFGTNNIIYKGYEFVGPVNHEKRDK